MARDNEALKRELSTLKQQLEDAQRSARDANAAPEPSAEKKQQPSADGGDADERVAKVCGKESDA